MSEEERQKHLAMARAQNEVFQKNRGKINTDKYYQDIIDAARDRGAYSRPTYGETYGKRIFDRR